MPPLANGSPRLARTQSARTGAVLLVQLPWHWHKSYDRCCGAPNHEGGLPPFATSEHKPGFIPGHVARTLRCTPTKFRSTSVSLHAFMISAGPSRSRRRPRNAATLQRTQDFQDTIPQTFRCQLAP